MGFQILKSIRLGKVIELIDLDPVLGSATVGQSNQVRAPGYIMGDGGGSAGQIVRLTASANIVTLAGNESFSSAENIVGMLVSDATSGLSAVIMELGRLDGIFSTLVLGSKFLGTAGALIDSVPTRTQAAVVQPLGFAPSTASMQFRIGVPRFNAI